MIQKFILNNDLENVADTVSQILETCAPIKWLNEAAVELCLTEALNNAIIHGSPSNQLTTIKITLETGSEAVNIIIRDPIGKLPPILPLADPATNPEAESGRGLNLMQQLTDELKSVDGSLILTFYCAD